MIVICIAALVVSVVLAILRLHSAHQEELKDEADQENHLEMESSVNITINPMEVGLHIVILIIQTYTWPTKPQLKLKLQLLHPQSQSQVLKDMGDRTALSGMNWNICNALGAPMVYQWFWNGVSKRLQMFMVLTMLEAFSHRKLSCPSLFWLRT